MDTVLAAPIPLVDRTSRSLVWTGRALTALVIAFLVVDGIAKLIPLAPVVEGSRELGYGVEVLRPLGAVLTLSALLHVIPRTQVLGGLLLTAYLGGATATHVRTGTPCWFPVAVGVLLWAGLCLRQPRLRALVLAPPAA